MCNIPIVIDNIDNGICFASSSLETHVQHEIVGGNHYQDHSNKGPSKK